MWTEGIRKLDNATLCCTNNTKNDNEMVGVEEIDLCSESQTKNEVHGKGKEKGKQESQDKMESDTTDRTVEKLRTKKSKFTTKEEHVETTMMCWEATNILIEEEPLKEQEKVEKKPIEKTENQNMKKNMLNLH